MYNGYNYVVSMRYRHIFRGCYKKYNALRLKVQFSGQPKNKPGRKWNALLNI